MIIKLGFGKRQRHTVIRQEKYDGALTETRFIQSTEDFPEAIIRSSNGGIIFGKLNTDMGIVKKETRNGHFIRRVNTAGHVWIGFTTFRIERLMRI